MKPDATKATVEEIDWVKPAERVTVWWQVFAYLIMTVAEILVSITGLELAFVAAPPTMKSFVTACWLAVVFLANLLINAPITRLYPTMSPGVYFADARGAMAMVSVHPGGRVQPRDAASRLKRDGCGRGGTAAYGQYRGTRRVDERAPRLDPAGQRRDVRVPGLCRIAAPLRLRTPWWQYTTTAPRPAARLRPAGRPVPRSGISMLSGRRQ